MYNAGILRYLPKNGQGFIQELTWWGVSHREGAKLAKPEARRLEGGDGVLGDRAASYGVWGSAKLPQRGPERSSPEHLKFGAIWDLKSHPWNTKGIK